MIEDAQYYPDGTEIDADICVIGAGAAGITIARHFADTNHRICLLESGGLSLERAPQLLSRGSLGGLPYEPLELARVRQFGGSTGRAGWGGWCKPLAEEDFQARDWVPMSGWPIGRDALSPHYDKASKLLELPQALGWDARPLREEHGVLQAEPCVRAAGACMGDHALARLRAAPNVRIVLHATVRRIVCAPGSAEVSEVEIANGRTGRTTVRAAIFVLAAGGIENPRLLLLSRDRCPAGLGNEHDLVGRFFMEHPRVRWGLIKPAGDAAILRPFDPRGWGRTPGASGPLALGVRDGLTLRASVHEEHRILRSRTWIKPTSPGGHGPGAQAVHDLTFWWRKGRRPPDIARNARTALRHWPDAGRTLLARLRRNGKGPSHFSFETILEQEPDRDSRVLLDESARDALGLHRAKLEWRVSALVHHSLDRTQKLILAAMGTMGWECVRMPSEPERADAEAPPDYRWVRHHMGTTRMAVDPREGVVDTDCRVHGVPNLYVAGSSVFPTGGNDMPTLTIVALAQRLAEHIAPLI